MTIWARCIVRYGMSKSDADSFVGLDHITREYPTNTELFYLEEAYREKRKEEESNMAYLCFIVNRYMGGKAEYEDYLPLTKDEREAMDERKMEANLVAWAAAASADKEIK